MLAVPGRTSKANLPGKIKKYSKYQNRAWILKKIMTRCGEVTDVYITEKGYAFVTMADDAGAAAAIKELNGIVIDGQEIKVDNAHGGDRRGGGGGGGFRGRSFSHGGGGRARGGGGFGGGRGGGFGGGRGGGGRGGFGGGRGGGGGGRGCYNCHQDGHIARECPEVIRLSSLGVKILKMGNNF